MTYVVEYSDTERHIPGHIAQQANALGLAVIMKMTTKHRVPTYLFYRDSNPVGYVQAYANAWLNGYTAARGEK